MILKNICICIIYHFVFPAFIFCYIFQFFSWSLFISIPYENFKAYEYLRVHIFLSPQTQRCWTTDPSGSAGGDVLLLHIWLMFWSLSLTASQTQTPSLGSTIPGWYPREPPAAEHLRQDFTCFHLSDIKIKGARYHCKVPIVTDIYLLIYNPEFCHFFFFKITVYVVLFTFICLECFECFLHKLFQFLCFIDIAYLPLKVRFTLNSNVLFFILAYEFSPFIFMYIQ